MKAVRFVCAVIGVSFVLSAVANLDIEEAQRQEEEYCYNVQHGKWPDFKEKFQKECNKTLDEAKQGL